MTSRRVTRGHGHDLGGKTITSRTSGLNPDFLSPLEKGMVAKQFGRDLQGSKPLNRTPAAPRADPAATGSKVEHVGLHGAPSIYREAPGGRRGMRGKRKSEQ